MSHRDNLTYPANSGLRGDLLKAPDVMQIWIGGEGGIRTLDTVRYTHFPGVLLRPLGHLSVKSYRRRGN